MTARFSGGNNVPGGLKKRGAHKVKCHDWELPQWENCPTRYGKGGGLTKWDAMTVSVVARPLPAQ